MKGEAILNLAAIFDSVMIWIIGNQSNMVNLNLFFYFFNFIPRQMSNKLKAVNMKLANLSIRVVANLNLTAILNSNLMWIVGLSILVQFHYFKSYISRWKYTYMVFSVIFGGLSTALVAILNFGDHLGFGREIFLVFPLDLISIKNTTSEPNFTLFTKF